MAPNDFHCSTCGDMHKKPINSCCPFISVEITASQLGQNDISSLHGSGGVEQLNLEILAELQSLGGHGE